jgi:hypothetical protein
VKLAALLLLLSACGRFGFDGLDDDDDAPGDDVADDAPGDAPDAPGGGALGETVSVAVYGGASNEEAYDIAVSSDGSFAITGTTDGGSFTVGSDMLTSAGGEDILLARFAADGSPLWARRIGSTSDDRGQAIAIDPAGNLYVAGYFATSVDFGGSVCVANGVRDAFIASYTATGTLRWVQCRGGTDSDFAYDILVHGPVVTATGYYTGATDFGTGVLPVGGMADAFIAHFDAATGTPQSAIGFATAGFDSGYGLAQTPEGNVVATGAIHDLTDLGNGIPQGAPNSTYVLELTPAGKYVWSTTIPNTLTFDVDVSLGNQIVLASRTTGTTDLGTGVLPAAGGNDTLTFAFDATRSLSWFKTYGGDMSDIGLGVAFDAGGNSYSIGLGGTDVDFGSPVGLISGHGSQDITIASYAPDGTPRFGLVYGGAPQDRGYAAAVAPDGSVYFSGRFAGIADFGTGNVSSLGGNDLFILRIE